MRLAPDPRSPAQARRMVRAALEEAGLSALVDVAVLLASELCDNAVLHGGTDYDVELTVNGDGTQVTVAVTDRGPGPLELNLAMPRVGRAASHGRGLLLVEQLSAAWGTRHFGGGHHQTWFTLQPAGAARIPPEQPAAEPSLAPSAAPEDWPPARAVRWLLHVPTGLAAKLELRALVTELLRRLCEVLDAEGAEVSVYYGDGRGAQQLANHGRPVDPEHSAQVQAQLPLPAPLHGVLRVLPADGSGTAAELAGLTAQRIALAVESEWLRGADQRRRSWMTYLADTSELLAQSLDVQMTVAMVPQLLVPRLGRWCAVHLVDDYGRLQLAAITHANEDAIPALRDGLDPARSAGARAQLNPLLRTSAGPVGINALADGVAVALTARGQPLGTLTVGRFSNRPHSPEEIVLVSDLARRASLAIDNARTTEIHVQTSQALQQALLPRQLPDADGVDFAAEYLPVSSGSDVGGDFYDVLALDGGQWLVSIGDVCGKGARAAARTGLVRDVLRVLVNDGRSPQRAIELLNGVMMEAGDPQQFCTLATAMVSRAAPGQPPGLAVELVLAGHERPVLRRAHGDVELIGQPGTAVGLVEQITPACSRHWLRPGDALVIYTDGVTERRRGAELFGQHRLLDAVAGAADGSAAAVVAAVRSAVEAFSADPRRDDIAILVVRAAPR
jgi:serine phosphatase RsbU (regulator of sigma subunit)/anti-sigma regulatory factor (Ser/Thr protein kinase)